MKSLEDLVAALGVAFELETAERPAMTLRSGDSIDVNGPVYPFDPALDAVSDDYLNRFADGLNYLDAISWRHYLPAFGAFALAHKGEGSNVVGALVASLRPPDREPPRLRSLSPAQEAVVRQLLEVLAFAEDSVWQNDACQALEEWWIENPLYGASP
ncbi:MAG: DUF6714 family protein [Gammaproteobacteria bacterium]